MDGSQKRDNKSVLSNEAKDELTVLNPMTTKIQSIVRSLSLLQKMLRQWMNWEMLIPKRMRAREETTRGPPQACLASFLRCSSVTVCLGVLSMVMKEGMRERKEKEESEIKQGRRERISRPCGWEILTPIVVTNYQPINRFQKRVTSIWRIYTKFQDWAKMRRNPK